MMNVNKMGKGRHGRKGTTSSLTLVVPMLLLLLSMLLLMLLGLGILSLPVASNPEPRRRNFFGSTQTPLLKRAAGMGDRGHPWVEVISWEPRAFLYHNFLSKNECEYLIKIAKPHLRRSTVVDVDTDGSKESRIRTSSGMFFRRGQDQIVRDIEKRIADFTFIPVEHGEDLQVLHYGEGQKYEPHYDYFFDQYNVKKQGGQRIATVLMYLSDVEEGGETVFPLAKGNFSSLSGWNERSECGKQGLSLKPKQGDALLFWSMRPDATMDPSSLHGSCPVIKGDKWSCTKWIRVDEYKY